MFTHIKERKVLEEERDKQLAEEKILNEELKKLKKKEFDELAKKGRLVEGKKEQLKRLKEDQDKLNKECNQMEQEIRVMDVLIRNHMDMEENLELRMMGLELSEDIWRKKWDEQQKFILVERNRLEDMERELKSREEKLNPTR